MVERRKALLREVQGQINSIETFGTVDGPGIRFVFFLQGCPLRCLYCHNPDTIPFAGGTKWAAGEAVYEALRYRSFIYKGGVTFSGGEPLAQPKFVAAMAQLLHHEGIHTALDTAGARLTEEVCAAIDAVDMLLLDIKGASTEMAVKISGKDGKNALATLDYCEKIGKTVWIRHVLLAGYTLDEAELIKLAAFLKPYKCVERVELLPFHKLGEPKWKTVGRKYLLADVEASTKDEVAYAKDIFEKQGLKVQ